MSRPTSCPAVASSSFPSPSPQTTLPTIQGWSVPDFHHGLLASNTEYLAVLENKFRYWVDHATGSVDWDRNGYMAPENQRVRAYANSRPGGACEYSRYNQTRVANAASMLSPSMARLGSRLYVFYSALGLLMYTSSTSSWDCPQPDVEPCGTWSGPVRAYMDAQQGVDIIRIRKGGKDELLIVTVDSQGQVWAATLTVGSDGIERRSAPRVVATGAAVEPTLAALSTTNVFFGLRGTDGVLRWKELRPIGGGWRATRVGQAADGSTIKIAEFASPGLVRAYLPWRPGEPALYGLFPDVAGQLHLWGFEPTTTTGRWEETDLVQELSGPVGSRPAAAWVPAHVGSEFPGRLYVVWSVHDYQRPTTRSMVSYVQVQPSLNGVLERVERVGLVSDFDNSWFHTYGSDLLFEPQLDTNLRSVHAHGPGLPTRFEVWFRPKADSINDFIYTDYNDWVYLRLGLCRNVVNPGGLVSNPIHCQ